MINTLNENKWFFPPTTNRRGIARYRYDRKIVVVVETDLFDEPVIAMSDIHSHTPELVKILDEFIYLDKFVVLAAGDMAGEHIFGTDGDPTPEYIYLSDKAKEFYFVQGNHDLPDWDNHQEKKIKNKQDKLSMIPDGRSVNSLIGKIGGVNGIISNRDHPYKMPKRKYMKYLETVLKNRPTILMTHETPSIYAFYPDGERYKGNEEIFRMINKYKPKIHFYGHCHHPKFHHFINGVNYINLDGRVIIFVPEGKGIKMEDLLKKPLEDTFSPNALKIHTF